MLHRRFHFCILLFFGFAHSLLGQTILDYKKDSQSQSQQAPVVGDVRGPYKVSYTYQYRYVQWSDGNRTEYFWADDVNGTFGTGEGAITYFQCQGGSGMSDAALYYHGNQLKSLPDPPSANVRQVFFRPAQPLMVRYRCMHQQFGSAVPDWIYTTGQGGAKKSNQKFRPKVEPIDMRYEIRDANGVTVAVAVVPADTLTTIAFELTGETYDVTAVAASTDYRVEPYMRSDGNIDYTTETLIYDPIGNQQAGISSVLNFGTTTYGANSTGDPQSPAVGVAESYYNRGKYANNGLPITEPREGSGTVVPPHGVTVYTENAQSIATDNLAKSLSASGTGGGSTTIDLSETNQLLNAIDTKTFNNGEAFKSTKGINDRALQADDLAKAQKPSINGSAGEAKQEAAVASNAIGNVNLGMVGNNIDAGTAPEWRLSIMGYEFDLNPLREDRFAPLARWTKVAFAWTAIIIFGISCSKVNLSSSSGAIAARQAVGNTVAGTGGQVTALINAGIITIAIAVLMAAVIAWGTYDLGAGSVAGMLTANPYSGMVGGSMYLLDAFFPLSTMVVCFVGRIIYANTANVALQIFAAVVRFSVA